MFSLNAVSRWLSLWVAVSASLAAGVLLRRSAQGEPGAAELLSWAAAHGAAHMDRLVVREFAYGEINIRGLGTKTGLANGSEVMRIPAKLLIRASNATVALGAQLAGSLEAALVGSSVEYGSGSLAVFLASEHLRGKKSFWAPHLAQLPTLEQYSDFHPFLGSEELFAHFGELPLVKMIQDEKRLLRLAWSVWQQEKACALAQVRTDISWPNFLQGYLWQLSHAAQGNMIPVFDLMNSGMGQGRAVSVGCVKRVDLLGYFEMRVNGPVGAGEEILTHYSKGYDNEMWLFRWGFLDTKNPNPVPRLDQQVCARLSEASANLPDSLSPGDRARAQGFRALSAEHCPASA